MIGIGKNLHVRATKPGVDLVVVPVDPIAPTERWGLSRIVAQDGWTSAAHVQGLAPEISAFYPPYNQVTASYTHPFCLVRLRGTVGSPNIDTMLFPAGDSTTQLGANLASVVAVLDTAILPYRYIDYRRDQIGKARLSTGSYTATTTLGEIVRHVRHHFDASISRPRPQGVPRTHNTQHLDPFTSDPGATFTQVSSTWAHDNTNGEMDVALAGNWAMKYVGSSPTAPNHIEHEQQCSWFTGTGPADGVGGNGVRFSTSQYDAYVTNVYYGTADTINVRRIINGTASTLHTWTGLVMAPSVCVTTRMAARGAIGNSVILEYWYVDHGASKPGTDPGWIGVDGSPSYTYTDSDASRLDDSVHVQCGIGGHWQGIDYDTRHHRFKTRAISDRPGGANHTSKIHQQIMAA